MKNIALEVENVSKQYRLGEIGTGTLSHDLNRFWARMRGKDDPFLKIGETNDRTQKGESDYVWALKDINFKIEQGDAVGIIGRNGAGKSTLLKLLSKVTAPTTGNIKVQGRIASLLEVGTGFHPEMTGRENIFLNGAILGMTKKEIKRKFDEIVDFSGVERYIDTPVKRYSSGMYVRLAFAVAAHLESEILIVDEVLAVGDSEFQKKCLGKMGDVSRGEGRTVLFVSHNMAAVKSLCNNAVFMENGQIHLIDKVSTVIDTYLNSGEKESVLSFVNIESKDYQILKVRSLNNSIPSNRFGTDDSITFEIDLKVKQTTRVTIMSTEIYGIYENRIFTNQIKINSYNGTIRAKCEIPNKILMPGSYFVKIAIHEPNVIIYDYSPPISFEIIDLGSEFSIYGSNVDNGVIFSPIKAVVE